MNRTNLTKCVSITNVNFEQLVIQLSIKLPHNNNIHWVYTELSSEVIFWLLRRPNPSYSDRITMRTVITIPTPTIFGYYGVQRSELKTLATHINLLHSLQYSWCSALFNGFNGWTDECTTAKRSINNYCSNCSVIDYEDRANFMMYLLYIERSKFSTKIHIILLL